MTKFPGPLYREIVSWELGGKCLYVASMCGRNAESKRLLMDNMGEGWPSLPSIAFWRMLGSSANTGNTS
jgi:hypothetical protein